MMTTICLNMIVKNEAHIIESTLSNICDKLPIDYWVIHDTGSTDNTVEKIKTFFENRKISGELHHTEWVDFSYNRNRALEDCFGKADYVFINDADDYIMGNIELPTNFSDDAYLLNLTSEDFSVHYQRILLVKPTIARWRGVVHEFIECKKGASINTISGDYAVVSCRKGARNLNKDKYFSDAQLIEKALIENNEPDLRSRYLFYCAQSYQDANLRDSAIYWYKQRLDFTEFGWSEERYMSCIRLGLLYEEKGNQAQCLYYWTLATEINPKRAEAWYHLSRFNNWKKRHQIAFHYALKAASLTIPKESLLIQNDIYYYWSNYEVFINGLIIKEYRNSYEALKKLILSTKCPTYLYEQQVEKIQKLNNEINGDKFQDIKIIQQALKKKNCTNLLPLFS